MSLLPTVILFPMSSKQSQQDISAHHLPHCEQGLDGMHSPCIEVIARGKVDHMLCGSAF